MSAWMMPTIGQFPYLQDYTIIIQHWGMMVGLMGIFMMQAGLVPKWRLPILLYSAMEKAFMVWLVLSNVEHSFVNGFWVPSPWMLLLGFIRSATSPSAVFASRYLCKRMLPNKLVDSNPTIEIGWSGTIGATRFNDQPHSTSK